MTAGMTLHCALLASRHFVPPAKIDRDTHGERTRTEKYVLSSILSVDALMRLHSSRVFHNMADTPFESIC